MLDEYKSMIEKGKKGKFFFHSSEKPCDRLQRDYKISYSAYELLKKYCASNSSEIWYVTIS